MEASGEIMLARVSYYGCSVVQLYHRWRPHKATGRVLSEHRSNHDAYPRCVASIPKPCQNLDKRKKTLLISERPSQHLIQRPWGSER